MGQKVHPLGFRLGVSQEHDSCWFAKSAQYSQFVIEDYFLRDYLYSKFPNAGIASIFIERQLDTIVVNISSARPRQLLGSSYKEKELYKGINELRDQISVQLKAYRNHILTAKKLPRKIKNEQPHFSEKKLEDSFIKSQDPQEGGFSNSLLSAKSFETLNQTEEKPSFSTEQSNQTGLSSQKITDSVQDLKTEHTVSEEFDVSDTSSSFVDVIKPLAQISINLTKVSDPDSSAACLAEFIVEQLERRVPFRRALKQAVQRAEKASVKGIKVQLSGRLNGAEIARSERIHKGQVPLHTLRAKMEYKYRTARTIYGLLGVKVWIFKGFKESRDLKIKNF